ncbi:MAG: hypothetical protein ABIF19_00280 [Planctomycetota bacterium]
MLRLESADPNQLADFGLIDSTRAATGKLLSEHIADFEQFLIDKGDNGMRYRWKDGLGYGIWRRSRGAGSAVFLDVEGADMV